MRREITYADQFEKGIFPVLLRGNDESSLPLRLVTRQYVDMRKDEEAGLAALDAAIGFYLGEERTMKMPRPAGKPKADKASEQQPASVTPVPVSGSKPSWKIGLLSLGVIFALCVVGAVIAGWVGYRMFTPQTTAAPALSPAVELVPAASQTSVPADPALPATNTPAPSVPAPDFISAYLNDVRVVDTDPFDGLDTGKWRLFEGSVENGVLRLTGNTNYLGVTHIQKIKAGEGTVIDFRYSPDASWEIFVDQGFYGEPTYKRFGVYIEGYQTYVHDTGSGNTTSSGFSGNLTLTPDTTYSLMIAYLPNAELLQVIWDPADPSKSISYRTKMDASWLDLALTYYIQAGSGIVELDNFMAIQFSGAK